jgi:hypothetical protein
VLSRSNTPSRKPGAGVVSAPAAPSTGQPQFPVHVTQSAPRTTTFAAAPAHAVPNAAAIQRAAALVEEQAQLAARLNVAAEMIDNLVLDSSVLDEAKRLTSAVAQKQQQRQQMIDRRHAPPPRNLPSSTIPMAKGPARKMTGKPRPSNSVFWQPPPDAARLCARCPSLDVPGADPFLLR